MPKRILIVDDESSVLRSLNSVLRKTGHEIITELSPNRALSLLEQEHFDLVISDMRMPEMSGHEFMLTVMERWPSTNRIILSGYADKKEILKSILCGAARAYLIKPWDNDALRSYVINLLLLQEQLVQPGLRTMVEKIGSRPLLPTAYSQVVALVNDDRSLEEIAATVAQDPELVVQILKITNSCFYGVTVGTVQQAIHYLGLDALLNIVLMSQLFESPGATTQQHQALLTMRRQANLTNLLLHALYREITTTTIPDAYWAAGLVHDIGSLLLVKHAVTDYTAIIEAQRNNPERPIVETEVHYVGISHATLGAWLLDWWNLPAALVESCLFHHTPLAPGILNPQISCLLHICDVYSAQQVGSLYGGPLDEQAFAAAGISRAQTETLINRLLPELMAKL
jgi:HD-like signal output (HDOD) protein